jgi:hypothetical protein
MKVMCVSSQQPERFTLFRVYAVSRVATLAVWVYDDTGAVVVLIERSGCVFTVHNSGVQAEFAGVEE